MQEREAWARPRISGMLVRYLVEEAKEAPVLAVDADPNSNLNEILGTEVRITIGDARELLKKEVPAGMDKETWMEMKVHEAIIESKGFDLLVMGRPEGTGLLLRCEQPRQETYRPSERQLRVRGRR